MMRRSSSIPTVVGVALCAYVAADLIHEVLGHGVASFLTPGVRALSLSSVALQTSSPSRFVSAAGSVANVLAGIAALLLARRRRGFDATRYFLLLVGAVDLLNGTGYLLFSGVLGIGDWAAVVRGLEPAFAWRAGLCVVGALTYAGSMLVIAREFTGAGVAPGEMPSLIVPAYLSGGLLMVAAAAMNPIDPMLILTSGASAGFGAMAGLLGVPALAAKRPHSGGATLARSLPWMIAGAAAGLCFVFVVGRGIKL
jgi:hypothetical protein